MTNTGIVILTALGCFILLASIWLSFWKVNHSPYYYFDAQDYVKFENITGKPLPVSAEKGTFEPLLKHYLDVAKVLITLAAASITFGGNNSAAPGIFVAKLILSFSILFGVTFCALVLYRYDEYTQDLRALSRFWYCTVEGLAFSSLAAFVIGYVVWACGLGPK